MSKPYMPLMMGDWIRGTRGMRAEVKGVYIGLLIHQYDHGFLPSDIETLNLIEPEVGKVWVILKDKFEEFEPGKLRNKKLEDVRDFWAKQGNNGKKGGRPKKENPNNNPKENPNNNHHNDYDIDNDIDLKNIKECPKIETASVLHPDPNLVWDLEDSMIVAFDEMTIESLNMSFRTKDVDQELIAFLAKVRGSPTQYRNHDINGLRNAFNYQLRFSQNKQHGNQFNTNRKQQHTASVAADIAETYRQALADESTG